jgi:hypothetical protein
MKKKWVTITLTEHFLVPEDFTDEQCSTHMIESLAKEGGWPGVKVEPGPPELYAQMIKNREDFWKTRTKSDYYDIEKGWFNYTAEQEEVMIGKYCFNVAELLEQGFMLGDHVVLGTINCLGNGLSGLRESIIFIGKSIECELEDLMPALQKLYENGPKFDIMYIESILMELYKTIVINYV